MEDNTEIQYQRLCDQWGPPEAHMRMTEIRTKTPEDLEAWARSCRSRAAYDLGKGNGDGFWEAKVEWYGARAAWLTSMMDPSSPRNHSPLQRKRPVAAIRPMIPSPKRRHTEPCCTLPADGGWPSGKEASILGPMPSGSPTGKRTDSSLHPEPLSPPPCTEDTPSLDLIKEYV